LGYGKFISPEGIRALKNYAYKPGHYTAIDNAMQPFWNTFVKLFPMWMAPNLITLSAIFFSIFSLMLFVPYDASCTMEFPLYKYLIAGFGVFMY